MNSKSVDFNDLLKNIGDSAKLEEIAKEAEEKKNSGLKEAKQVLQNVQDYDAVIVATSKGDKCQLFSFGNPLAVYALAKSANDQAEENFDDVPDELKGLMAAISIKGFIKDLQYGDDND